MRRPLRRLTIATTTIAAAALIAVPALAKVSSDSIGQKATIGTEAGSGSQPAQNGGDDGGGKAPESAPVSNAGSAPVNQGTSQPVGEGTPVSVSEGGGASSSSTPGVDPTQPIYFDGSDASNAQPGSSRGGRVATIDGGTPPPIEPEEPAADPLPADEPEPAAEEVDVQALAQTATSQMTIRAPEIASTPNDPDTLGAVGLPVWFWVANPGTETTGPNTTSATAGDVTVTATATFTGMTITTGDGTTIQCDGPGTEYPGTGIEESPDCGHIYVQMSDDQPDGVYTVDITAHWTVDWNATTGETGTIPIDLTTDKQLRIGSYQAVVTG